MARLPKYVNGYVDRHGKPRFYFRRRGFKRVALPFLPWSPEFMAAYEAALAGQDRIEVGAGRTMPGTMRALAVSYFASPEFRSRLQPSTQSGYRGAIERLCKEHGDKRVATLQREHIVRLLAARAEKPEAANRLRKALRALMKHAIEIGLRSDDPSRDTKAIRVKSDGYHSWSEPEIEQFEATHPIGTRARLAFSLLLYTGQRRSDVTRMGRQHIRNGLLHVRQQKTGAVLSIPVHPTLAAIIADTPAEHMTFITTHYGHPFGMTGFGKWFRDQCDAAGLRHCTAHGLRKGAARRLAEAGCTEHEIAAITGHASLREVQRYTRAADQTRLAISAIEKVKTRTPK
jgi:integrase